MDDKAIFNVGDVVELKSISGPDMVVEAVDEGGVYVLWFNEEDQLHRDYFINAILEAVEE
jgi:uncharacterized protein YodC (DUF2158 family)